MKPRKKLEQAGISCFVQNGEGITDKTDLIVVSTAIEDTVAEVQKAKQLNIPILRRSGIACLNCSKQKNYRSRWHQWQKHYQCHDILEFAGLSTSNAANGKLISIIKEGK